MLNALEYQLIDPVEFLQPNRRLFIDTNVFMDTDARRAGGLKRLFERGQSAIIANGNPVVVPTKVVGELTKQSRIHPSGETMERAEAIKKAIGSAFPGSEVKEMEVKGRNLSEGIPRSFTISSNEILEALTDPLNNIVSAVKNALEQTPPELGADIAEKGMMLTGGGALLRDLDRLLMEETGLPVLVAEDPLTCVVRGSGMALERMDKLGSIFSYE